MIQTASERVRAAGLTHVSFIAGDASVVAVGDDFDAAVGRCVLVHNSDPVATLRAVARHVRPGGIVAFEEPAHTALPPTAMPACALLEQAWGWMLAAYQYAGIRMGLRLFGVFRAAGLGTPEMHLHAAAGGGPDWAGYDYMATHLRNMLPLIVRAGVASEEEVGIETFAERLRTEATRHDGAMTTWGFVTAWSRRQ